MAVAGEPPTGPWCRSRTRSRAPCGSTLDTLAFDAPSVSIVGEHDQPITHSLIARGVRARPRSSVVLSHPQADRPVRALHPLASFRAEVRSAASTAEAVREVTAAATAWAAIGSRSAAEIYGCVVLREGDRGRRRQRHPVRLDRPRAVAPVGRRALEDFALLLGARRRPPGALVEALTEFSSRDVNLTRIESRPLRRGLGRYMFFIDLEGSAAEPRSRRRSAPCGRRPRASGCSGAIRSAPRGIPGA